MLVPNKQMYYSYNYVDIIVVYISHLRMWNMHKQLPCEFVVFYERVGIVLILTYTLFKESGVAKSDPLKWIVFIESENSYCYEILDCRPLSVKSGVRYMNSFRKEEE